LICAFKHVDTLGAYSIPSETGLLISSVYNNAGINGEKLKYQHDPSKWTDPSRFGQTIWSAGDFSCAVTQEAELDL
jgi:hypothetical protein